MRHLRHQLHHPIINQPISRQTDAGKYCLRGRHGISQLPQAVAGHNPQRGIIKAVIEGAVFDPGGYTHQIGTTIKPIHGGGTPQGLHHISRITKLFTQRMSGLRTPPQITFTGPNGNRA
jgi:hypothetical protein